MPLASRRPDDRVVDLIVEVNRRYGMRITPTEGKCLRFLMDVRLASHDAIDDILWPDLDGFDLDFRKNRAVHISRLKKKFGNLIEIVTFWGVGYALKRLGPVNEPMHERENPCR